MRGTALALFQRDGLADGRGKANIAVSAFTMPQENMAGFHDCVGWYGIISVNHGAFSGKDHVVAHCG